MGKITYNRGTKQVMTHNYLIYGLPATTGQTLLFTVKPVKYDADDTDSAATTLKKTITMAGSANLITILASDIADTVKPGTYFYDIKIIDSVSGGPFLADSGTFNLVATPTNRLA